MSHSENSYEKSDVNPRNLFIASAIVVFVIIVSIVVLNEIFLTSKEKMIYDKVLSVESAELRDIRAKEAEILNNYKLLNPQLGKYQVPIEKAMELLAEEAFQDMLNKAGQ
jgi:hypothetical protein